MRINKNLNTNLPQINLSQNSRKAEAEAETLLGGYNKKEIDKYLKDFDDSNKQNIQVGKDPCYLFKKFWQSLFGKKWGKAISEILNYAADYFGGYFVGLAARITDYL